MTEMVTTCLMEKNYLVREGLKNLLAETNFKVTEVSASAKIQDIRSRMENADLVIYGIDESDKKPENIIGNIREIYPHSRIAILSSDINLELISSFFAQGVHGYLTKNQSPSSLLNSLYMIIAGEKIYPAAALDSFTKKNKRDAQASNYKLSSREVEILMHVADGKTNKEIALLRDIAESTVKAHIKTILRKLNLSNRTQAARWVLTEGFADNKSSQSVHVVNENGP